MTSFVQAGVSAAASVGLLLSLSAGQASAQAVAVRDSLRMAAEVADRAGNAREALRLYVQHQRMLPHVALDWLGDSATSLPFSTDSAIYARIFQLAASLNPPPALPDSAMIYEVRAQIAFDSATTNYDFIVAESQYGAALYYAPWVPRYWWNAALIRERRGRAAGAVSLLKVYLASPQIDDRDAVRRKLIALEYQLELIATADAANLARARDAAEAAARSGGGALTVGTAVNGVLMAGDSTLTDGSYFDTWFFPVAAGQRVRIRMTSASFTPSMYVFWNSLVTGIHAEIRGRVAEVREIRITGDGTIFVRANSAAVGTRTGPYTLVVEDITPRR